MTEENYQDDASTQKSIIEMLTVANEYCLFFERAKNFQPEEILGYFRKIAPLLYLKGSTLPAMEVSDESLNERYVTEEQWETIFKTLRDKFGARDVYFTLDLNNDSKEASLADNMADIYQDMKDFVMLYQKGTLHARENAVAQLQELMAVHWGVILLEALKASHVKVFKNKLDGDIFNDDDSWLF